MQEARLDYELKRIHDRFSFLWEAHGFQVAYFTRDHGMYNGGFVVGLQSKLCKLVFVAETSSSNRPIAAYVGKLSAYFRLDHSDYFVQDDWFSLTGLIYWLSGVECEHVKNTDQDLENVSQYLKLYIDKLLELFNSPKQFDEKLDYYRNLYRGNQITVDKIRAERARLQALGQDSSLEAAIVSLRGGKK